MKRRKTTTDYAGDPKQDRRKERNRALKLIRSLNGKPKPNELCEYGFVDIKSAILIKTTFLDIFRKAASDRLRIAVEKNAWALEEGMIQMQRGVEVPPWVEDLWAIGDPSTPIKTLRAAGVRLTERIKDLDIPTLATIFESRKKRGPQGIEEPTLRRIKLVADLHCEGVTDHEIGRILFAYPAKEVDLSAKVVDERRYSAFRAFKHRYRQEIEARIRWRNVRSQSAPVT